MWGKLCHGAAGISGFPIWVQLLGHLFFDTIDRDGKYRVSQQVLDENFVSIKFREIKGHHMVSKPVRKMGSIPCAKNIGTSDFAQIVLGLNK